MKQRLVFKLTAAPQHTATPEKIKQTASERHLATATALANAIAPPPGETPQQRQTQPQEGVRSLGTDSVSSTGNLVGVAAGRQTPAHCSIWQRKDITHAGTRACVRNAYSSCAAPI